MVTGGGIAQMSVLEKLHNHFEVHCLITPENVPSQKVKELQQLLPNVSFILSNYQDNDKNISVPPKTFKTRLILKLTRLLKTPPTKVTLRKSTQMNDFLEGADSFKVSYLMPEIVKSITDTVKEKNIDVISADFPMNLSLPAIPSLKHVKKVLIHHEIKHSRIETQIDELKIDKEYGHYRSQATKVSEVALINQFDSAIVFSEADKNILEDSVNSPIHVSPFGIPDCLFARKDEIERQRNLQSLVLLGNDKHIPNKVATEWFINEVYLKYELHNKIPLKIIGDWSERSRKPYQDKQGITFMGFVKDLDAEMVNSALLAPINIGGGLRTKIMLAMAQGVPVICTPFACTGINLTNLEHAIIAKEAGEFETFISKLANDDNLYNHIRQQANKLAHNLFSSRIVSKERAKALLKN